MQTTILVASIQMTSSHNLNENLLIAEKLIQQASAEGAELIVLPEMFGIMGLDQMDKIKYAENFMQGPIQDFLQKQAQRHKVWIVGGTIPIIIEDNPEKVFAACLLLNDQGECVARYNKIHMFDVSLQSGRETYSESKTTKSGDNIVVVQTPFGKLGLAVCYDLRFPELFREMQKQGVEIIVLPAAFTYVTGSMHWEVLVRARAIENLSYMVTACQTGIHPNHRKTFGHSMIVNPWGEILAMLPDSVGVITANLDLKELRQIRNEFPALDHRRI